jgi:hypothetical protein
MDSYIGRLGQLSIPSLARASQRCGAQLPQRAVLDLAHPLGADPEASGDVAQAFGLPIQAVAGFEDRAFAIAEAAEQVAQLADRGLELAYTTPEGL